MIAGLVSVLGFTILMGVSLFQEHDSRIEHARLETENIARVMEGQAKATIEKIDIIIKDVQGHLQLSALRTGKDVRSPDSKALHSLLEQKIAGMSEIDVIHVANAEGDYINSSLDPVPAINISDREFFRVHQENQYSGLVISSPLISRTLGTWAITVSRRVDFPNGNFAGIVNAILQLSYFEKFYSSLNLGTHGAVLMRDSKMRLLARHPTLEGNMGMAMPEHPVAKFLAQGRENGTYIEFSPADGVKRIYCYRRVGEFPLYVLAAIAEKDYLAEWYKHIVRYSAAGLVITFTSIMLLLMARRSLLRQMSAEKSSRESESRFRVLIEQAPEAILVYDVDLGLFVDANTSAERLFCCSRAELLQSNPQRFYPPEQFDQRDGVESITSYSLRALAGEVVQFEREIRSADGRNLFCVVNLVWLPSEQGRLLRVCYMDITRRKEAEKALQISEERLRTLFDGAPIGMCRTTLDGRCIDANATLATMFGFASVEELIELANLQGTSATIWLSPEAPTDFIEKVKNVQGLYVQQEVTLHLKDGTLLDAIVYMMRTTDPATNEPCLVGFIEDVTKRKKLEGQLHQSQKMESIGRLAGGIAHDFNNMLSVILGAAELSMIQLPKDNKLWQNLTVIKTAAERSRDITRQLLAFSRKEIISPKPTQLNTLISESQKNLGRLIGEDVRLIFRLATDLWMVKIDPSQLDQILMNLSVNARDAMPDGGTLIIETANIHISDDYGRYHNDAKPGDYVQLTVSDTGFGMDRDTQRHIFEPFFTTKKVGQGTGLGLSTVFGIVTQNNGFINVYSEPGQGTSFKVYFQRLRGEGVVVEEKEVSVTQTGTERILLVEDEEMLLWTTTKLLEEIGYTVIQAQSPEEAISICERDNQKIDLILTDVVMPGMNGRKMVDRIWLIRPNLKVLFMSGYTSDIVAQRGIIEEGMYYIQKPLGMNRLNEKIRGVLASP